MRPISATTTIDCPRERVIGLLTDLAIRPSFVDHFATEYRLGRIESKGVGASARFALGGEGRWMDTVIDEIDFPHTVREHGETGRANRVGVFTVWELAEGPSPEGCEVTVTFWTEPETLAERARDARHSKRRLRRGWKRALARLRDLAETGAPVERVGVAGGDRPPAVHR